jgi:hypothetical protein
MVPWRAPWKFKEELTQGNYLCVLGNQRGKEPYNEVKTRENSTIKRKL